MEAPKRGLIMKHEEKWAVTHFTCPEGDGGTHHLIPRKVSRNEAALTCIYCKKTEKQLRKEHYLD